MKLRIWTLQYNSKTSIYKYQILIEVIPINGQFYEGWKNRYPVDSAIRPSYNRPQANRCRNLLKVYISPSLDERCGFLALSSVGGILELLCDFQVIGFLIEWKCHLCWSNTALWLFGFPGNPWRLSSFIWSSLIGVISTKWCTWTCFPGISRLSCGDSCDSASAITISLLGLYLILQS